MKDNANNLINYIREHVSPSVKFEFERHDATVTVENLNEGGMKLVARMNYNDLDKIAVEKIEWKYLADPTNESSYVTRKCRIVDLGTDFADVIFNKRFDKNYLRIVNEKFDGLSEEDIKCAEEAIEKDDKIIYDVATEYGQIIDNVKHTDWFKKAVAKAIKNC